MTQSFDTCILALDIDDFDMSLDAYKERQDRAFDTFRSKYRLTTCEPDLIKTHTSRSSVGRPASGRTLSASTFGEATGQSLEFDTLEIPTSQLMFAPQIRKLEVAPWEDAADSPPVEQPKKPKPSRVSILKKLKRVTSGTKTSPAMEPYPEDSRTGTSSTSTSSSSTSGTASTPPSYIYTSASPRRSDIPLGRPLDTSDVQVIHEAIAFKPIDPNILHLKTPTAVSFAPHTTPSMKPSRSTPQIEYEIEYQVRPADRMSRMFDSLKFD